MRRLTLGHNTSDPFSPYPPYSPRSSAPYPYPSPPSSPPPNAPRPTHPPHSASSPPDPNPTTETRPLPPPSSPPFPPSTPRRPSPVRRLFGKMNAEDLLLLLLIFTLWQEESDPSLIAALVYLFLDRGEET